MIVFLELEGNKVLSCHSSSISPTCIEVEIEDFHPIWFDAGGWKYVDGVLFKDDESYQIELLDYEKEAKRIELDRKCNEAILAGFSHVINSERYWFSYDKESQFNFTNLWELFNKNIITEQMWTVKNSDGDYVRIVINKELMKELLIITDKHVSRKISKYRDYYMSLIMEAQTIEEVEGIQWEADKEVISEEELQAELKRVNNTPTVEQLQSENENLKTAILELSDLIFGEI